MCRGLGTSTLDFFVNPDVSYVNPVRCVYLCCLPLLGHARKLVLQSPILSIYSKLIPNFRKFLSFGLRISA